jgi:predicted solute-binding protein
MGPKKKKKKKKKKKHLMVSSAMKTSTSLARCWNLKSSSEIISKLFKNLKQIFKPIRKPIDIFACSHYKLLHLTN